MDRVNQAGDMVSSNRRLMFQNEEKGKRAAELMIANIELAFQIDQKVKRAAELVIANRELAFQNEENEKRAEELVNANRELEFQNLEKEKRADELIIANKELELQNLEKERRAEELIIAYKSVSDYKYALDESAIVAITNQKGIITHVNENFCRISKFSYAELVGNDHRIMSSSCHSKEFIRNMWATIESGRIWCGELKNKAKDGTFYWVDTTIVPFLDEHNKPYQYVAIRSDITQRKQAEEEIRMLNEELGKRIKELESFSYSVSHDLRSPLRAVNGYARMLQEDYEPLFDVEGRRLLGEVQKNAKKMGILIDDLLSFSRLGKEEVKRSGIDMNALVETVLEEINQTCIHHAELKIAKLLPVMADYALIKQVMTNLISNALKYSSKKEKPVIELNSERADGEIIYSVKDNGAGFSMEYAHKLFGVFQRLHSEEEFSGTGVGLAIVERIIQKHNGKINAVGIVGEGATFSFSLPDQIEVTKN